MSNSFIAELRKLAEQAENARLRKEAEARAEQLRAKREAAAAARAEAKRLQEIEQEKQRLRERKAEEARQLVIAQEAERKRIIQEEKDLKARIEKQRRDEEAEKERKIREEKALRALGEKKRMEEEERARRYQAKLAKICREIYVQLAVAAWDGQREILIKRNLADVEDDLRRFGIEVRRPKKLANALGMAMIDLLGSMDAVSNLTASWHRFRDLQTDLADAASTFRDAGHTRAGIATADLLGPIQSEIDAGIRSTMKRREHAVETINQRDNKTRGAKIEMQELRGAIADARRKQEDKIRGAKLEKQELLRAIADAERKQEESELAFGGAVDRIRDRIQDIESAFSAALPHGLVPSNVTFGERADALRIACSTHIPDVKFGLFSDLQIVNMMRLANGLKPIDLQRPVVNFSPVRSATDDGDDGELHILKLERLLEELNEDGERIASLRDSIGHFDSELRSLNELQRLLRKCQSDLKKFNKTLELELEDVTSEELRFIDGQYVGPTFARLGDVVPEDSVGVSVAYGELLWLLGDAGKDFCGYVDIVLAELAKEGTRSVVIAFCETESTKKIEIGTVSLVCDIRHDLLGVLFSTRGFDVKIEVHNDAASRVDLQLSW